MQRLLKKLETAVRMAPQPVVQPAAQPTRLGVLYFGSTSAAMAEALDALAAQGIHLDAMRVRAFPFAESVRAFIEAHDTVYVVEQNRDAQMRTMLMTELDANPSRLQRVLHYDGTPITARFIIDTIARHARQTAAEAPPEAA